jgi:hypothetical protein
MGLLQKKFCSSLIVYSNILAAAWFVGKKMEPMIGFDKTDDSPSQSRSECCGNHLQ